MAGTKDLIIEKGATFLATFTWSTKDTQGIKTPVNLTNYTARSQMRESYDATTAAVSLTTSVGGGITLGGALGTISINIPATTTSAITIDNGVWDLELEDASGNVTRLLEGKVTFKPEATK